MTGDHEVDAIIAFNTALEKLDPFQRARVLDYTNQRWHPRQRNAVFIRQAVPKEVRAAVAGALEEIAADEIKQTLNDVKKELQDDAELATRFHPQQLRDPVLDMTLQEQHADERG